MRRQLEVCGCRVTLRDVVYFFAEGLGWFLQPFRLVLTVVSGGFN